ncbi:MAG: HAMP domain-containing histidine kinase [Mogibacterium sp.]|nr:HAMP domain-containing histidine kinase [Mogibacterium sp.]
MIRKLKRRFIALAMASLVVLMTVIVAGMNIINYNTVINEADDKLAALSVNGGMLPFMQNDSFGGMQDDSDWASPQPGSDAYDDDDWDAWIDDDDYDDIDAATREGLYGRGKPFSSRDEAEETRFFSVLLTAEESVVRANTDRIYAVDDSAAAGYAKKALEAGGESGWVDEYRYAMTDEGTMTRITFLDCSTSLAQFRQFLRASIIMSLAGLLIIFGFICYFAGRIVKPVAESYDKQKHFITDAGHEIKTPLAIIKANIDVMRMDLEDIEAAAGDDARDPQPDSAGAEAAENAGNISEYTASLSESLGDIDSQVDRLTSLTNDLVYLSRMEEAGNALTMTEIPVSDIVAETADSFEALAAERKKTLSIDVAPMLTMQGSSKEIEKLVSILTENALKYSPEGDEVKVTLRKEGKTVVLEVRNKAVDPLSDEDLEHVFDRFYRSDKSRNSASGGHGIGLSMASAIVTAHGGKIRARSGDGSEFIVTATMPA